MKTKTLIIMTISSILLIVCAIVSSIFTIFIINNPKKEYLDNEKILLMNLRPDNFKNKYVKLVGEVTNIKVTKSGLELKTLVNTENYRNYMIIYCKKNILDFNISNYISIEGYVKGFSDDNIIPYIISDDIKIVDYNDTLTKELKENLEELIYK